MAKVQRKTGDTSSRDYWDSLEKLAQDVGKMPTCMKSGITADRSEEARRQAIVTAIATISAQQSVMRLLKIKRRLDGASLRTVAARAGYSSMYLSYLERGRCGARMSQKTWCRLARAYGIGRSTGDAA